MGYTLFSDKNGIRVSIKYLKLFKDLDQVSSYAWEVAALAYLYRQLGYASRGGVKQIIGHLPLMRVLLKLSYDFLNILYEYTHCDLLNMHVSMITSQLASSHNMNYTNDLPRACMWV